MTLAPNLDDLLLEQLATFAHRPYDWVLWAFPWGEPGTELEHRTGPEPWQTTLLLDVQAKLQSMDAGTSIREAIREAIKSGHDIGKTACVSWLALWAISTRVGTKGVITANTERQLRLKTWAELSKWHRLMLGGHFFKLTSTALHSIDPRHEKDWRIDAIPWSEENTEGFQGLHNYGNRVLVIFDEASGIINKIWEVVDGVMQEADTELIWCVFGNPTRNTGRFRECFDPAGQGRFWSANTVDSREVSFTNKAGIQAQIDLWGIDNDFIKVRWLGLFPSAGTSQLIDSATVRNAMTREAQSQHWEPLILGVDVARFGDNQSVIQFRRGRDARSIPTQRFRQRSTVELGMHLASLIGLHSPDAVFIDEGGIGGGVIDFVRHLGHSVIGVNFGAKAGIPLGSEKAANKRAEMYLSTRHWLREGGAIPNSEDLYRELVSIEYGHNKKADAILLQSKDDMDESPDWADALALTFAYPVSARSWRTTPSAVAYDYDPLAITALPSNADLYRSVH